MLIRCICLLILLPIFSAQLFAAEYENDTLTSFFKGKVDNGRISGVHVVVLKDGIVEYSKQFGYSNIEKKTPLGPNGIYRIASMTKIVSAIAALQLWEQGRFNLDDPVSKFISAFENIQVFKPNANRTFSDKYDTEPAKRQPTIRDLLRHTAGIRLGEIGTQKRLRNWQGTLEEYVQCLAEIPLDNNPGTKFEYGFSIDVLGLIIEKLSGQPLDEYCKEHIFEPLKLSDTSFVISDKNLKRLVNHYELKDDKLVCIEDQQTSPFRKRAKALSAGGGWDYSYPGLLTSANDWVTIMETIRNNGTYNGITILKQETVDMMCQDQLGDIPGFQPGLGYGLGIGVVTDTDTHGLNAANGTVFWAGSPHNTFFYIDKKNKISALMFLQSGPFYLDDIMNQFWQRSNKMFNKQLKPSS